MEKDELFLQGLVSALLGLFALMMGKNFARYVFATLTGKDFHTGVNWTAGPLNGQEVKYFELQGYTAWSDMGLFLIGLVAVLDGLLLLNAMRSPTPRPVSSIMFFALVVVGLLNLLAMLIMMSAGIVPLLTLIAVIFAAYSARTRWLMMKS